MVKDVKCPIPGKKELGTFQKNYENSMKCLKGQIGRLKEDPDILKRYDAIIKEHDENGIIDVEGNERCRATCS